MFVWIAQALAQLTPSGHLDVPGAGFATEDGPGTGWVNPANLAFDADPRFAFYVDRRAPADVGSDLAIAATGGVLGQALGVTARPDGVGAPVTLDWAGGVELSERFAVGGAARWHVRPGDDGATADLAASWRPSERIGFAAVGRSLGGRPEVGVTPLAGLGLAVRPSERLIVGLDGARHLTGGSAWLGRVALRARVSRGFHARGWGEIDGLTRTVSGGAAIELYAGGLGVGLGGRGRTDGGGGTLWLGTGERRESIFRHHDVPVADLTAPPPSQRRRGVFVGDGPPTWLEVLDALGRAGADPDVARVVIVLGGRSLGSARLAELRSRVEALQRGGTAVTVFLAGSVDSGTYWAASAADQVLMHPSGSLDLVGVSVELQHMRGLLDLVGVQHQVVRQGDFKTAAESLTHTSPSPEQLEQFGLLLDDLDQVLVSGIAAGRGLGDAEVRAAIDGGPWLPDEAVARGLIDAVVPPDGLQRQVRSALAGRRAELVELGGRARADLPWRREREIAVVYVEGAIVSGASGGGGLLSGATVGAATVVRQLDAIRRDGSVEALVLRVDSPGGSVIASDDILAAVERVRRAGKPVVVSMGSVAASGGYYVAARADAIWAHPGTITGSIGVISTKTTPGPLLERLGVQITRLERGENAGLDGTLVPWDDAERARAQALVDGMYGRFKNHVAEGRALSAEAVEAVARGRVWSGRSAAERGLIDGLGGLEEAIEDAAKRADIPPDRVRVVGQAPSAPLQGLFDPSDLLGRARIPAWAEALRPLALFAEHPEERVWLLEPWVTVR